MRRAALLLLLASGLLAIPATPAHAAFPGKNGKIAFVSNRSTFNSEVYSMNPDGSGVTDLSNNPARDDAPDWSPDGTKITFATNRDPSDPNCDNFTLQCNSEIYVMNSDGTGQTRLTYTTTYAEETPGWTPDGRQITFHRTESCSADGCSAPGITINADGTGWHYQSVGFDPRWSPDGKRIMGVDWDYVHQPGGNLVTRNADGSGYALFCCNDIRGAPQNESWSPDGSAAVFEHNGRIERKNLDGTGGAILADPGTCPAWSPDGNKIAFEAPDDVDGSLKAIYVMNADGTGKAKVFTNPDSAGGLCVYSWQPLPINGYARPKGATPFQTYLTVAYKPCDSPNEQHGAPLAALSCSPPQQASDYLTVGTLDSNGQKANAIGSVRYDVKPGTASNPADDADVKMAISVKDVRLKDLSDYTGELQVTSARRITDKLSTPAPDGTTQAATTQDTPFSLTVPCAPTTADDTIGSLCTLSTTADAIVPGQVTENARSNWELGQVKVYDGGADSDADTTADNTLFMDEGVFVP